MDLEERWQKTLAETHILRFFYPRLSTQDTTILPYIFVAASIVNNGDTVVRKGQISVDKPLIILPKNMPQFSGFNFEEELGSKEDDMKFFLMMRGVNFPSLKYHHKVDDISVVSKDTESVAEQYKKELEQQEDINTGLVLGPIECWQLSILMYVGMVISRSAPYDIKKFLKEHGLPDQE